MPSSTKKSKKKKHQSGNPALRAAGVTSARDWKQASAHKAEAVPVELPSGHVALCNRVGMKSFLERGAIPDYLTPIVQKIIREKQFLPPEKEKELATDTEAQLRTAEMLDRALVMTVVEPEVRMPPGCEHCGKYLAFNDEDAHNRNGNKFDHDYEQEERDEETLYADEVDLADKLFLFHWSVGGGTDLTSFRKEYGELVEYVASLTAPPHSPEPVARD